MGKWVRTVAAQSIPDGEMMAVQVAGGNIALYNLGGEFFATSNICTHALAFLTDGWLEDGIIECPLHAGKFDVRSGRGLGAPISCDLPTFPTRIEAGIIEIDIA